MLISDFDVMKILYYHRFLKSTETNALPGHFFNGVLGMEEFGIKVSYLENSYLGNRIILAIKVAIQVIFQSESFDLIYGSTPYGLELVVLLRSLGLFRKPIVVWHHRAIKPASKPLINRLLKLYYSGFDKIPMFTTKHIEESLRANLIEKNKMMQIQWGPDAEYFDQIMMGKEKPLNNTFCSTGRENRDFPTLISAFSKLPQSNLIIYTTKVHGKMNNEKLLMDYAKRYPNVDFTLVDTKNSNRFLANEVYNSLCAVVSCNEHNYTVGLTSLVEAMALKTAIITSDNPYFPFDVEKEGFGIKVKYNDVEGWTKAINYLTENPEIAKEMGLKGRKFVDEKYNLLLLTSSIARSFFEVLGQPLPTGLKAAEKSTLQAS